MSDKTGLPGHNLGTAPSLRSALETYKPQSVVEREQAAEAARTRDLDVGLGDYAKLAGKGAADLVSGVGFLADQATDYLQDKGAAGQVASLPTRLVGSIGELAGSASESLGESLSPDAKEAMSRSLVSEDADGAVQWGDGAGDIDVWAAKMAHGIGTMLPTLGTGGLSAVAVRGLVTKSMLKRGASQEVAEAVASKAAAKVGQSAAVGVGATGAVGGGAQEVFETVNSTPVADLMESDTFRQAVVELQSNPEYAQLPASQQLARARELTAERAAGQVSTDPASWAFGVGGALMGDRVLFKMLAGKAATKGVLGGMAKGAVAEGVSEAVQEGGQTWVNNNAMIDVAGADIDPMQGVVSRGLEGGLIGAGTGGALGGVGGLRKQQGAEVAQDPHAAPAVAPEAAPAMDTELPPTDITVEQSVSGQPAPSTDSEPAPGEQSPLGVSNSQIDEIRDVPAYLRQDTALDGRDVRPTWSDDEAQQALSRGESAPSPADLVRQQMEQGPASEAEPEQLTGEIETWQPNWRFGQQERAQQAPDPVEGEYVPRNNGRDVHPDNRLEGPALDGNSVEIDESRGLGFNGAINMPGQGGVGGNPNYVPPLRERQDRSVEPQSIRDPRTEVGQAIQNAGTEADAIWQHLSTLRKTRRGKPFASEKEAQLASRKDETPVKLPEGYGVAKSEEVAEVKQQLAAQPKKAEQAEPAPEVVPPPALEQEERAEQPAPQNSIGGMAIVEAPVSELSLSDDVPQFKDGANKQGVVEPLGGTFDRTGVAPIQVWKRQDGRLEVISGRHRLDLAKRSGEQTIPAQVHDEAAGFDQAAAATLDAELNIRDNQGKVKDYVQYFQATGIDRAEADRRGYTARALGRRAYQIATGGSEETIAAHRAGILTDDAAERITTTAPQDARLQAVGIKAIQDGKSITHATNMMQAVKALGQPQGDGMGDMFGFDDSAMQEAEQMAKLAAKKQREIGELLRPQKAVKNAGKLAEQEGITDNLPAEQREQRMQNLQSLKSSWDNWSTNPDLVAELRSEIRGEEVPALSSYSEQDLQQQADQLRQAQDAEREAQSRYDADQEVDDFRLSGSSAPADVAMSHGQNDMFTQTIGQAEAQQELAGQQKESDADRNARVARAIADNIERDPARTLTQRAVGEGVSGSLSVHKQSMKTSGRNVVFEVHDDNGVVAVGPAYPAFEKGAAKAAKADAEDLRRGIELSVSEGKTQSTTGQSPVNQAAEPAVEAEPEQQQTDAVNAGETYAPLLHKSDGSPFATEKSARISKVFKDNPGATIEPVEGGFAVRKKPVTLKRGEVGGMLGSGEVVLTSTGNRTSPFPDVKFGSNRTTNGTLKAAGEWLITNARLEAARRGDEFNGRTFDGMDQSNPTQADKDHAEYYLFDPEFVTQANGGIGRPLAASGSQASNQAGSHRNQITTLAQEMAEQYPDHDFKAANSKFNLLQRAKDATGLTFDQLKAVMPPAEIRAAFEQAKPKEDSTPASERRSQQLAEEMTPEQIRTELDALGDKATRRHEKAMKGADANTTLNKFDFMSADEQARFNDLKQALPSAAQERAEARQRIEQRAEERKAKRERTVSKAGVSVAVPSIEQELVDGYNRATHMGKGRDLNAELKGEAESLLDELAGKRHLLDTDEQKAEAASLIDDYLQQYADFHRWNARQAINNPSWFVTGRDGRNMAKVNAANERHNDEHSKRVERLEKHRDSIARTLYELRPVDVKAEQALRGTLARIGELLGHIAGFMQDGRHALEKETRGWASPKAFDAMSEALAQDRERTLSELVRMDGRLQDVGGLVKVLGPRSKAGKLASELLAAPAAKQWRKAEGRKKVWEADDGTIITDESFTVGGIKTSNFFVYRDRAAWDRGDNYASGNSLTEAKQKAEQGSDVPAFSTRRGNKAKAEPLSASALKDTVKAFFSRYKGADDVNIQYHETAETLPGYNAERDKGAVIEGQYDYRTDTLHLVRSAFDGKDQVEAALREEILVHKGLGFFSPVDRQQLYQDIQQAAKDSAEIGKLWDKTVADYQDIANSHKLTEEEANRLYAEEMLGSLAQRKVNWLKRGWNTLWRGIKRLLVKAGWAKPTIGEAELRSRIELIANAFEQGKRARRRHMGADIKGGVDLFSRSNPTTDSALDKLNLGAKPDAIDQAKEKLQALRALDRDTATNWLTRVSRKANTAMLDALAPIKYIERAIGITDADQSGYVASRLASGSSSTMLGALLHGLPEWQGGIIQRKQGTGEADALLGILQPLGKDLHNWLGWMAGHRAEILMAEGRENLLTPEEIQALKDLGQGKEAQFRAAKQKWNAFNAAILDLAQEAGMVNPEARANFESEWYIPFFRETEDGDVLAPYSNKGMANQRSTIKQLKGGTNKTNDLLENMFHVTSKTIDAAMKNHAARRTVENLMDSGIVEVIEKPTILDMRARDKGQGVISFRHHGEDVYARVADDDLFKAMTFLDRKPFDDPFTKVGQSAKRLLTAAVTSSPEFMLRNFLRDMLSAWTINKDHYNPIDAFKGAAKAFRVDKNTLDMMFAGASFMGGYVNAQDPNAMADTVRKALRRKGMTPEQIARYEKSLVRNAAQAKGVIADAWAKYQQYGEAAENGTREAVYEAAIKAGKSKAQAAFEAKDLMDFSMLGSARLLQWFVAVLPFFNARLQGLGKLGREFRDNPINIAKRGGLLMAASAALLAMNWDNEEYEKLPDWDKDMHWHFWLGDQHVRIPKPFEVGVLFGTIPERALRAMGGKDSAGEFGKVVGHAMLETFALNPVPQAINPALEVFMNYDSFRGRAIENQYEQTLMPAARYDERTSDTMRALGELTGMSPKQLEHLVNGYLGTMGAYGLMASDFLINLASDRGEKAASHFHDWPIIKAIYRGDGSTPASSTKYIGQMYDMLDEVTTLHNTVNAYRKDHRIEDANALLADDGDKLRARASLTRAQRQLRQLRNQMDLIRRDKSLDAEQKRQRLDQLLARRNDLAARVVQQNRQWFE